MRLHTRLCAVVLSAALLLPTAQAAGGYTLRAVDGQIAVLEGQTGQVITQTRTPISALPRQDRALLTDGLTLGTLPELTQALEDFCS